MTPIAPLPPADAATRRWLAAVAASASQAAGVRVARAWLTREPLPDGRHALLCHGETADGHRAAVDVTRGRTSALDAGEYGRRLATVLRLACAPPA